MGMEAYTGAFVPGLMGAPGVPEAGVVGSLAAVFGIAVIPFPGWLNAWAVLLLLLGNQPAALVLEFSFCNTYR